MGLKMGERVLKFNEALYNFKCINCRIKTLDWEADFDADGTTYFARCCERFYYMEPYIVKITISWDDNK